MTQNLQKLAINSNYKFALRLAITLGVTAFIAETAFAAGNDAFADILTKANGWVSGSVGKLITFTSLTMAGIMGVAGFPARQVVGTIGVGLLLSSAESIVKMLFN